MPTVPSEFVQSVMPQGVESYQNIQASPNAFGAQVGEAMSQLGRQLNVTGDMLSKHAERRMDIMNETNVQDTVANQYEPQLRDIYNQFYKLQGKDAEEQYPQYQEKIQTLHRQMRESLANVEQQRMFDRYSLSRSNHELDAMARHASTQTLAWQAHTHSAMQDGFVNLGADKYNDPKALDLARNSILAEAQAYGHKTGTSPEMVNFEVRKYTDKLYSTAIARQAINDPLGAQASFRKAMEDGRISGEVQEKIAQHLDPLVKAQTSRRLVDGILTSPEYSGGDLREPIVNSANQAGLDPKSVLTTVAMESSFDPTRKNPKSNAHGLFQVIDSTWVDMGGTPEERDDINKQIAYGVKNLQQSVNYLKGKLGRDLMPYEYYMANMQGGAGAAKLITNPDANAVSLVGEKAILLNGGTRDMTAAQFLGMWRKKFDAKAASITVDGAPTAQQIQSNYAALEDQVRAKADAERPGDAVYRDIALSHFRQQAAVVIQAEHLNNQAHETSMLQALADPNGPKDLATFLSDPQRLEAYTSLYKSNPGKIVALQHAIDVKAKREENPPATYESNGLWYSLLGKAKVTPDEFVGLNMMDYYGKMPLAQWHQLVGVQQAINKHDVNEASKQVDIQKALHTLRTELGPAGYTLTPKTDKDKVKLEQFTGRLGEALDAWRQNNKGKRPGPEDIVGIGRQLLAQGAIKGSGYFWDDKMTQAEAITQGRGDFFYVPADRIDKNVRKGMVNTWKGNYGSEPDDRTLSDWATAVARPDLIPDTDRQQIVSAYQSRYGKPPTVNEIAMRFVYGRQAQAKAKAKAKRDETTSAPLRQQSSSSESRPKNAANYLAGATGLPLN